MFLRVAVCNQVVSRPGTGVEDAQNAQVARRPGAIIDLTPEQGSGDVIYRQ